MGFLSKVTVSAVGLWSKALLNSAFCSSVAVKGLDNLIRALEDGERDNGRGVVTSEYSLDSVSCDFFKSERVCPQCRTTSLRVYPLEVPHTV